MKYSSKAYRGGANGILTLIIMSTVPNATAAVTALDLGTASGFGVLAGSGITIAGPVNSTFIEGDIGSFPTPSITGQENLVLDGVNHGGDAVTQQAKIDLQTAFNEASTQLTDVLPSGDGLVLSGTLLPGGYKGLGSISIDGILTLDAQGDSDAVWIIGAGTTLITASSSEVVLLNGAKSENVFWQVGSSATLGTNSDFVGSILALTSITLTTGADMIEGRALAINGAVTLDNNTIVVVPEPSASLLIGSGLALGLLRRRRAAA